MPLWKRYPAVRRFFLSGGDFTDIFGDRVSCTRQPDGSADYTLCYDSSWQLCTHADAAYTLQIRIQPSGRLLHGCFYGFAPEWQHSG